MKVFNMFITAVCFIFLIKLLHNFRCRNLICNMTSFCIFIELNFKQSKKKSTRISKSLLFVLKFRCLGHNYAPFKMYARDK